MIPSLLYRTFSRARAQPASLPVYPTRSSQRATAATRTSRARRNGKLTEQRPGQLHSNMDQESGAGCRGLSTAGRANPSGPGTAAKASGVGQASSRAIPEAQAPATTSTPYSINRHGRDQKGPPTPIRWVPQRCYPTSIYIALRATRGIIRPSLEHL